MPANADHTAIAVHRGARRVSYARAAAIPTAMCPTLAISYVAHYKRSRALREQFTAQDRYRPAAEPHAIAGG